MFDQQINYQFEWVIIKWKLKRLKKNLEFFIKMAMSFTTTVATNLATKF